MRAIWSGAITFGLVNVPVRVYSATEDHDISLHQVHNEDGGRIRYQRTCEVCGKVVAYDDIDKAYEDRTRTVVLTDDDLKSLPEERSREIDVVEFVPTDQIDPIMFDRSYFLEPSSNSIKSYVLLRRTLEESNRTAIVHFALRQKTRLGALRVHGDVLMLQSLLWHDEVREAKFPALDEGVRISAKELEMSEELVSSFESDFEPERFTDDYQQQLRTLVDAKIAQGDSVDIEATFGAAGEPAGGEVLDVMEALRRSVEKSRAAKKAAGKGTAGPGTAKKAAGRGSAKGAAGSGTAKKAAGSGTAKKAAGSGTAKKRGTA